MRTRIITWPHSQLLMDQEGYKDNCALINSRKLYRKYGDSAYAVSEEWLESLPADVLAKVADGDAGQGPDVDFDSFPEDKFPII